MSWIINIVMFWVGGSFGFVFGAWWLAAHMRERQMNGCADTAPPAEDEA
ncbi:hypothetical protein K1X12_09765 [Hyphomonas sp. WL0036]|nr:hypothetical protein [Hyphomonas sediminis]MBY9067185.1 hypothetical protein [Hyphomonas sediminis]